MKNPLWLLLFVFVTTLGFAAGCKPQDPCPDGTYTEACRPPKSWYDNRITEGKRSLSNFDGKRAAAIFKQVNEDHIKFNNKPYCKAVYGVVLADVQVFVENLNGLALRLLTNSAGGGGLAPDYRPAAAPFDYGNLIENGWSSFEPVLAEISDYAQAVTALDDCSFSIGLGDRDETLRSTEEINPYQYVLNIGGPGGAFSPLDYADETKIKNAPVAQIVFKARFDDAEARLIDMVARTLLGGADYLLAHDFSMTLNLNHILYQLGIDVIDCARKDILNCSFEVGVDVDTVTSRLLGWSFLFQDNPGFLGKSATRWDRRMPFADNEFAGAFYTMRTFFRALVARNENMREKALSSQELDEYVLLYRDNNENSVVDAFDELGFTFTELKLSPEFIINHTNLEGTAEGKESAANLRKTFKTIENAVNGAKSALTGLKPSEGAVNEIQTFIERGYANFAAVDDPSIPHERIPISSFNAVMQDILLSLFIDAPLPNFMELDVTLFFTDPKPMRDFVPHWKMTPNAGTMSEFIVDSDEYAGQRLDKDGNFSGPVTAIAADKFMHSVEWSVTTSLWADGERDIFTTSYDGGIRGTLSGLSLLSDCINAENMSSRFSLSGGSAEDVPWAPVHLALPDPSLNGMIWVNLDAWLPTYDNSKNGVSCMNDPVGLHPANNYSITKGMWLFVDFVFDHFSLLSLF